jgi:hypothetical protein
MFNYPSCLAFGLMGEGGAGNYIKIAEVPVSGALLPKRIYNKRKHLPLDFGLYRGMALYYAACYMNPSLEEGPWSPVEQITVP